jgi:TonB family protein
MIQIKGISTLYATLFSGMTVMSLSGDVSAAKQIRDNGANELLKYQDEVGNNYIAQLKTDHKSEFGYIYEIKRLTPLSFRVVYLNSETLKPSYCAKVVYKTGEEAYSSQCSVQLESIPKNISPAFSNSKRQQMEQVQRENYPSQERAIEEKRRREEEERRRQQAQAASNLVSSAFGKREGYSSTGTSATPGWASYDLGGRSLIGGLPKPVFRVNASGTVVVSIAIDASGRVTDAKVSPQGTTTSNTALQNAAIQAAYKAHFTAQSGANVQYGTITYQFDSDN